MLPFPKWTILIFLYVVLYRALAFQFSHHYKDKRWYLTPKITPYFSHTNNSLKKTWVSILDSYRHEWAFLVCIYSGSCDLELMGFSNFCSDLGQQWTHVELEKQKDGAVYGGLLVLAVLNFSRQHALGHWWTAITLLCSPRCMHGNAHSCYLPAFVLLLLAMPGWWVSYECTPCVFCRLMNSNNLMNNYRWCRVRGEVIHNPSFCDAWSISRCVVDWINTPFASV